MTARFTMVYRSLAAALLAGLLGVGAIACTTNTEPQQAADSQLTPPPLGQVQPLADARDVTRPLDTYTADERANDTLVRARQILSVECMRGFGFDQTVPPPPAGDDRPPGGIYGISYGPEVERYGYHQPPDRRGVATQPPPAKRPSDAELGVERGDLKSYNGRDVPAGGCLGEADRALDADPSTLHASALTQKLVRDARSAAEADARLIAAFGQWSECMKRSGYDYKDPWAANNDPAFQTEQPTDKEIATARADLRCRTEVNLNGLYYALDVAYQEQLIERHGEALAADKAKLEERIDKATKIVAGK